MKPKNAAYGSFHSFATKAAYLVGTKWAFVGAVAIIVAWAASGPYFHYSDTWQLVVNTGTTVVTFLVVFLIQNTQNRDSRALHLKLDEVIHAIASAKNEMIDIEDLSEEELEQLSARYQNLRTEYEHRHPPKRSNSRRNRPNAQNQK